MISDKKFIELLNLYLDHEISTEEVRVLEAEIRREPARRELYRQYCAMHKGCLELASTFAPKPESEAESLAPIAASEIARSRSAALTASREGLGWPTWVGGLGLAAACGAMGFFVFSHKPQHAPVESDFAPSAGATALVAPMSAPRSALVGGPHLLVHTGPLVGKGRELLSRGGAAVGKARVSETALVAVVPMAAPAPAAVPLARASVYGPQFPSSYASPTFEVPVTYTSGPAAETGGGLGWGALVNLNELREREAAARPTFQVRPPVAPSPRVYHRKERRFEGGRVEMTRFQFQR